MPCRRQLLKYSLRFLTFGIIFLALRYLNLADSLILHNLDPFIGFNFKLKLVTTPDVLIGVKANS